LQVPAAGPSVAEQLERRRRAAVAEWDLTDEVVVVGAGDRIHVPGRGDLTYPYRSHSEYFYLTDRNDPGGVLAFDPSDGWIEFVVPVTAHEMLWGDGAQREDGGRPVAELPAWLAQREGRPIASLGCAVEGVAPDPELESVLRHALNRVRRPKDAIELDRMRRAASATAAGFSAIVPMLEEGVSEREVQIELEATFFRSGADILAFDTIVAGGPNSAVLHFAPTDRRFGEGELVLIDAGGEYRGYASDVTRTFGVGGRLTAEQRELYGIVRSAGLAAIERSTPGTEFTDIHWHAARVIAEGLVDFGLLRGDPDSLVERRTVSLFFPHSVGHMVGLGVRDAGGLLRGRPLDEDGFPRLRIDLPLEPGHGFTIEPGFYFVAPLLQNAEHREQHREAVHWERVDRMLGFGGIRIEDNVVVAEDGPPEVLTADIPA
jgi:Xaa-Pro aminopeptidase